MKLKASKANAFLSQICYKRGILLASLVTIMTPGFSAWSQLTLDKETLDPKQLATTAFVTTTSNTDLVAPRLGLKKISQVIDRDEEIAFVQDRDNVDASERSLLDKVQGLQQELQELRGQLEMQAHHLKTLQQQQLSFYKDLDERLRQPPHPGETGIPSRTVPQDAPATLSMQAPSSRSNEVEKLSPPSLAPRGVNLHRMQSANEQLRYLAAYDLVKSKRFDEALEAMQSFILQYPRGGYTANAEYWLGELFMVKNNYPKAIDHFETVLRKFPLSSKTAASTLKIGYALAASGKMEEAKMRLQEVLKNYPDTPTAQLAATKLDSLGVS